MPNTRQTTLPLSRPARLDALKAIDPAAIMAGGNPVSPRAWRSVCALLEQIEFCSTGGDSSAYVATLAARMNVKPRTVQRARAVACAAGLLVVETRYNRQGQASNGWRVEWARISGKGSGVGGQESEGKAEGGRGREEGEQSSEKTPPEGAASAHQNLSPTPDVVSPTGDLTTPPGDFKSPTHLKDIGSLRSSEVLLAHGRLSRTTKNAWSGERGAGRAIDVGLIRERVARIERALGPVRSAGDWSLAVKASMLAERFGEAWLWGGVEGVVRSQSCPRFKRWANLHTILAEKAELAGVKFLQELARLELPAELARPDPRRHTKDGPRVTSEQAAWLAEARSRPVV